MSYITEDGIAIKRQSDITSDIAETQRATIDSNLDLSANSVLGTLNGIFGSELATVWEYIEDVYNQYNIRTAEGFHLDNLVLLGGITRQGSSKTTGTVWCGGTMNTRILAGSYVSDAEGNNFETDDAVFLTPTQCVLLYLSASNQSTTDNSISVTIEGVEFSYDLESSTEEDFAAAIVDILAQIEAEGSELYTAVATEDDPYGITIQVTDSYLDQISVNYSSAFENLRTYSAVNITATQEGYLDVPENSVTVIGTPTEGWVEVYNRDALSSGTDTETDEELRARFLSNQSKQDKGTVNALYNALTNLTGVTSVQILKNETMSWQDNGVDIEDPVDSDYISGRLPPKSFECIVGGGDASTIAQTIWDTKPIGIATHGTNLSAVEDENDLTQYVSWTRPANSYAYVQVLYTLSTGGTLLPEEVSLMEDAIVAYGDSVEIGGTIVNQMIIGAIYAALPTSYITNLTVKVALSDSLDVPPLDEDYVQTNIVTTGATETVWDSSRITNEVEDVN